MKIQKDSRAVGWHLDTEAIIGVNLLLSQGKGSNLEDLEFYGPVLAAEWHLRHHITIWRHTQVKVA